MRLSESVFYCRYHVFPSFHSFVSPTPRNRQERSGRCRRRRSLFFNFLPCTSSHDPARLLCRSPSRRLGESGAIADGQYASNCAGDLVLCILIRPWPARHRNGATKSRGDCVNRVTLPVCRRCAFQASGASRPYMAAVHV